MVCLLLNCYQFPSKLVIAYVYSSFKTFSRLNDVLLYSIDTGPPAIEDT